MAEMTEPPDPENMDDDELMAEHDDMRRHEDANTLTEKQEEYLEDLQNELFRRLAASGEHADYSGENDE